MGWQLNGENGRRTTVGYVSERGYLRSERMFLATTAGGLKQLMMESGIMLV